MLQIQHIKKEYRTGTLVQKALDDVSLNLQRVCRYFRAERFRKDDASEYHRRPRPLRQRRSDHQRHFHEKV